MRRDIVYIHNIRANKTRVLTLIILSFFYNLRSVQVWTGIAKARKTYTSMQSGRQKQTPLAVGKTWERMIYIFKCGKIFFFQLAILNRLLKC